jgi:hypothetical protein
MAQPVGVNAVLLPCGLLWLQALQAKGEKILGGFEWAHAVSLSVRPILNKDPRCHTLAARV